MNRQKWIEGAKVIYHPEWIRRWRDDPFSVPPIYLEISPAGACNHRCVFCAPEMLGYKTRFLDPDIWAERLSEMKELRESDPDGLSVKSMQYAGEGEPTLHKHFERMLILTHGAGIDVGILSNGTGLSERRLPEILPYVNGYLQLSINAGARESYAKIHQTESRDWDLVWRNLANAVKFKKINGGMNGDIGVNLTVLTKWVITEDGNLIPPNWPEVEALVARAKDTGLDYVSIKPYSQHPYSCNTQKLYGDMSYGSMMDEIVDTGQRLIETYSSPDFEVVFRFSRFKEYEEDDRKYTTCNSTPTLWGYVQADGVLISCSGHWTNPEFHLGNVNRQTFKDIWYGEVRRKHLNFVLNELDISICRKTCHPDKDNKFLFWFKSLPRSEQDRVLLELEALPKPKRANFI